jgi:hypothetical protein
VSETNARYTDSTPTHAWQSPGSSPMIAFPGVTFCRQKRLTQVEMKTIETEMKTRVTIVMSTG